MPITVQASADNGERILENTYGRPELVRAALAEFLHEAQPKDFILGSFFYFRFDIQVIFSDSPELFDGLGAINVEDEHGVHWKGSTQWPVIFLVGRYKKRTMLLIDAWRFFSGSLASVCRELQLPFAKMAAPPCIKANREPTEAERPYFNEYAMVDSDAGLELTKRIDSIWAYEQQGPCISIAHLAGKKFRRDFTMKKGLDVPDERGQELGLLAAKGGRNSLVAEKLPLIVENCAMYDVRSLYPFICSEVLPSFYGGRWAWQLDPPLQGAGIYLLTGELTRGDCWPYRLLMGARGEYLEPGAIQTVQTGYEIQTALKHDLIKPGFKLQGMIWEAGKEKYHPFKAYYAQIFGEKESHRGKNPTLYKFYKDMANSLTGKFASTIPQEDEDGGKYRVPGLLYNPSVYSFITGAGRCLLFEYELQSKSVHGATDSLVVPPWGIPPNEGTKMGDWEKAVSGTFVAARNKLYAFISDKTHGNYTGWLDKDGNPIEKGLDAKTPCWKGKPIPKYALHAFKGTVFQFLDAVFSGQTSYTYARMVQIKESRKRKNLKPLQMNTFVEELKLGGKYFFAPQITRGGSTQPKP